MAITGAESTSTSDDPMMSRSLLSARSRSVMAKFEVMAKMRRAASLFVNQKRLLCRFAPGKFRGAGQRARAPALALVRITQQVRDGSCHALRIHRIKQLRAP